MTHRLAFAALLWLAWLPLAALADVDWGAHTGDDTVVVTTHDEDGSVRARTIWLLVLDGQPYIRTGSATSWGENVLRDPDLTLTVGDEVVALRAERVSDPALLERITAAFREKYGFGDRLAALVRGDPIVFRVSPR
jgi:hypothetical protein